MMFTGDQDTEAEQSETDNKHFRKRFLQNLNITKHIFENKKGTSDTSQHRAKLRYAVKILDSLSENSAFLEDLSIVFAHFGYRLSLQDGSGFNDCNFNFILLNPIRLNKLLSKLLKSIGSNKRKIKQFRVLVKQYPSFENYINIFFKEQWLKIDYEMSDFNNAVAHSQEHKQSLVDFKIANINIKRMIDTLSKDKSFLNELFELFTLLGYRLILDDGSALNDYDNEKYILLEYQILNNLFDELFKSQDLDDHDIEDILSFVRNYPLFEQYINLFFCEQWNNFSVQQYEQDIITHDALNSQLERTNRMAASSSTSQESSISADRSERILEDITVAHYVEESFIRQKERLIAKHRLRSLTASAERARRGTSKPLMGFFDKPLRDKAEKKSPTSLDFPKERIQKVGSAPARTTSALTTSLLEQQEKEATQYNTVTLANLRRS